ncbi:MAG: hypothetical protein LBB91_07395, partial [Clostridiales bacterium]|nr:hypothetical protein [Clostridiales bacterium]
PQVFRIQYSGIRMRVTFRSTKSIEQNSCFLFTTLRRKLLKQEADKIIKFICMLGKTAKEGICLF